MKEIDDLALEYTCAYCLAEPGDWCRTKTGARAEWLHSIRTNAIASAYGLGWQEGDAETREHIKKLSEDALLAWRQRLLDGGRW